MVQSQPGQIVFKTLYQKNHHVRTDGVAQGGGPEFKPWYHKKKKSCKQWELLPPLGNYSDTDGLIPRFTFPWILCI
jgi:hypothetical protein